MKSLDYFIIGLVLLALFWAIRTVRSQKGGCGGSCSGDCSSCKKKSF